jgi:hypothetical protein
MQYDKPLADLFDQAKAQEDIDYAAALQMAEVYIEGWIKDLLGGGIPYAVLYRFSCEDHRKEASVDMMLNSMGVRRLILVDWIPVFEKLGYQIISVSDLEFRLRKRPVAPPDKRFESQLAHHKVDFGFRYRRYLTHVTSRGFYDVHN